jgi:hypothetical protein
MKEFKLQIQTEDFDLVNELLEPEEIEITEWNELNNNIINIKGLIFDEEYIIEQLKIIDKYKLKLEIKDNKNIKKYNIESN